MPLNKKSKTSEAVQTPASVPNTPKAAETKKPAVIIVRLLKGSQVTCPTYGDVFVINKPVPVTQLSNWTKFQATVGLLEITE